MIDQYEDLNISQPFEHVWFIEPAEAREGDYRRLELVVAVDWQGGSIWAGPHAGSLPLMPTEKGFDPRVKVAQ